MVVILSIISQKLYGINSQKTILTNQSKDDSITDNICKEAIGK